MSDVIGTAKIVAELDSSGVEVGAAKGKRALADLGVSASKAGKQASDGIAVIGKGGDQAAQKVDAATRNMIGSIQRQIAAMEAGSKSGSEYYKVLAGQRGVDTTALKPYLDQLDAAANKQGKAGVSAAQMANNLRMVGPQVTDIVTSLQAGQKPLTVFIQQGGQLKDVFGGIGPAAKALGGYVLGLVNPYTLAAGAAAALGYAFYEGSKQSKEFAEALAKTGDYAGKTEGQFNDLVKQISAGSMATVGTARELAQALISTGQISAQTFNSAAAAAASYTQITGKTAEDVAKDFAKMASEPAKFAVEINRSMNLITAKQYEAIKAFEENGRAADAQGIIYDALNQRAARLESGLGSIEKALISGKKAWSEYWDKAFNVGREETSEEKLAKLDRQIENAKKLVSSGGRASLGMTKEQQDEFLNAGTVQKRAALVKQIFREQENAYAESLNAEINKQGIAASSVVDGYLKRAKSVDEYKKKLDELNQSFRSKEMSGTPVSDADKKLALDQLKKDFTNKSAINASLQIDKAKSGLDVATIKAANDQLVASYTNTEKILEAQHAAGLISDRDYYDQKRDLISKESVAEADAMQREIDRLKQRKLSGADALNNEKDIVEKEAKLAILRGNTATNIRLLNEQQADSVKRLSLSYLTARQAAQDYFDTLNRQQQRALAGLGQGAQKRNFDSGVSQIEDRYAGQRRDLENQKAQLELEGKFTEDARAQYDKRLSIIDEFQKKSIASYADYYSELMKKQGDWALGASEGLNNYLDDARNVFKQTENLVGDAFGGMEDALVNFVQTGKLSFGDLTKTIIADLARMEIKALASKIFGGGGSSGGSGSYLSSIGGALFSGYSAGSGGGVGLTTGGMSLADYGLAGGYADGGDPPVGKVSLVGERGPELFIPKTAGTIIPNDKLGGKATTITYAPVINIDSRTDRAQIQQDVQRQIQAGHAQLVDQLQRARVL